MALTKIGKEGITGISNASDATFLTATSGEGVTLAGTLAVTGVHTVGTNAVATSDGGAATTNIVQGLAKQWCHTSGVGTPALADSFNTASVTDLETGGQSFTFTSAMANANFSTQALVHLSGQITTISQLMADGHTQTTAITAAKSHTTSAAVDADKSITVHGDLA